MIVQAVVQNQTGYLCRFAVVDTPRQVQLPKCSRVTSKAVGIFRSSEALREGKLKQYSGEKPRCYLSLSHRTHYYANLCHFRKQRRSITGRRGMYSKLVCAFISMVCRTASRFSSLLSFRGLLVVYARRTPRFKQK